MKLISPNLHAILDYLTVVFLFVSAPIFGMTTDLALFTFSLSGIHFILTAFTESKYGIFQKIPLPVHGAIELIVGIMLFGLCFWFKSRGEMVGFYFYLIFSLIVIVVWLVSDYSAVGKATTRPHAQELHKR